MGRSEKPQLAHSSWRNLMNTYTNLKDFTKDEKEKLDHLNFVKAEFNRFLNYLITEKKHTNGTIDKHVKIFKRFLSWAYPEKEIQFVKYRWKKNDDVVALDESEMKVLIEADLHGYLDKTRDLFVFCATTGMRYSDSQRFQPAWITDDVIEYRSQKTSGKSIVPL